MWEEFARVNGFGEGIIESHSGGEGQLSLQFLKTGEVDIIYKSPGATAIVQQPVFRKPGPGEFVGATRVWMIYLDDIDLAFDLDMDPEFRDLTPENFAKGWRKIEAQETLEKNEYWDEEILSRISKLASFYEKWQPAFTGNSGTEAENDGVGSGEEPGSLRSLMNGGDVPKTHQDQAARTRLMALHYKKLGDYEAEKHLWCSCQEHLIRAADEQFPSWAEEDKRKDAEIKNQIWKRDLWWEQILRHEQYTKLNSHQRKTHGGKGLGNESRKNWGGKSIGINKQTGHEADFTESETESDADFRSERRNLTPKPESPKGSKATNPKTEKDKTRRKKSSKKEPNASRSVKRKRPEDDDIRHGKRVSLTDIPSKRVRLHSPVANKIAPTMVAVKSVKRPRGKNKRLREESEGLKDDAETISRKPRKMAKAVHKSSPNQETSLKVNRIESTNTGSPNQSAHSDRRNPWRSRLKTMM